MSSNQTDKVEIVKNGNTLYLIVCKVIYICSHCICFLNLMKLNEYVYKTKILIIHHNTSNLFKILFLEKPTQAINIGEEFLKDFVGSTEHGIRSGTSGKESIDTS